MSDVAEDEFRVIPVDVTNPDGVTFPAVLCGSGFSKAGVVEFYVLDEDAPEGEVSGQRCEFYRQIHASRPPYIVRRRG